MNDLPDLSQDSIREWLLAKCKDLGTTPTGLARDAGVNASTLNRFAHKPEVKHRLSATTIEKVQAAIKRLESDARPGQELGDRLRSARDSAGLSQTDLAERAGITQQAVQSIESGTSRTTRHLHALAEALRVEPEWLMFGNGSPTRESFIQIEIKQRVTVDQAARIFAILNEGGR